MGLNTSVNVRMTVVKLEEEGEEDATTTKLFVYNLIAPTRECVQLLRELGHVDTILLPTTTFEHKQFLSNFSKTFPKAKIVLAPGQYTYPVNLKGQQGKKARVGSFALLCFACFFKFELLTCLFSRLVVCYDNTVIYLSIDL